MHTLVDPLQMSLDLSRIANEVAMTYGDRDPDTGKRPQVNSTNQTGRRAGKAAEGLHARAGRRGRRAGPGRLAHQH